MICPFPFFSLSCISTRLPVACCTQAANQTAARAAIVQGAAWRAR
jgi:hypothetical protein